MTEYTDLLPTSTDDEQSAGNRYLYYTEGDLARILDNLEQLRSAAQFSVRLPGGAGALRLQHRPGCGLAGLQRPQLLYERVQQ
ncbi:hypothetical protein [Aeromonas salmonicida]|uniref:hypothetical protein n=1 Tax=Aeromonas salmonicida TaxID=645 RepID=UPI001EDF49DC|nr:hypothetical protein [Aeromonas salmonicida]